MQTVEQCTLGLRSVFEYLVTRSITSYPPKCALRVRRDERWLEMNQESLNKMFRIRNMWFKAVGFTGLNIKKINHNKEIINLLENAEIVVISVCGCTGRTTRDFWGSGHRLAGKAGLKTGKNKNLTYVELLCCPQNMWSYTCAGFKFLFDFLLSEDGMCPQQCTYLLGKCVSVPYSMWKQVISKKLRNIGTKKLLYVNKWVLIHKCTLGRKH